MACFGAGPSFFGGVGWMKASLALHDSATWWLWRTAATSDAVKSTRVNRSWKYPSFFQKWRESVGKVAYSRYGRQDPWCLHLVFKVKHLRISMWGFKKLLIATCVRLLWVFKYRVTEDKSPCNGNNLYQECNLEKLPCCVHCVFQGSFNLVSYAWRIMNINTK